MASEHILDGIRIIDLSWGLSGPVATQILAEAGADVIKVERPGGDPLRTLHPSAFASWNRSRRSVVLNVKEAHDRTGLDELLVGADVLVHGFRPSRAVALGLDDVSLRERFPALVVCAITGYPHNHPDAERPGYDLLVQARGGLMDFQAGWSDGPFAWRFPAPSWFAALLASAGIVARLIHRQSTGVGGPAHTSLVQGLHLAQSMVWADAERPPASMAGGPSPMLRLPQVAMYVCSDQKWIQILNPADRIDLSKLPLTIQALGELGLADVPFNADVFAAAISQHPSDAWLNAIRAVDVAVELISPLGDLLKDPDSAANGFVVEVNDPVFGRVVQAGPPFKVEPPMEVTGPAPTLGSSAPSAVSSERTDPPAAKADNSGAARPLDGVRILDLGAFLAGPLASMLLSDLGADVIKVEPVTGDPIRGWRDEFFIACNRGKRGLALDIKTARGNEILRKLIADADVVHHNVRVEPAARLGIDEASVRALNPQAVFGHSTSYGLLGDRADWPGYDSVFQSMSGWSIELAGKGNPPLFNHLGNLDMMNGTLSAVATLLALFSKRRTGRGTGTHAALMNTAALTNSETMVLATGDLAPYPHLDKAQTGLSPGYRIYRTSDGWVAVAALDERRLSALRAAAGVGPDAGADELASRLAEQTTAGSLDALEQAGVPAEAVKREFWRSVWDDRGNVESRVVVAYPQADWGRMRQFGAFWSLGDVGLKLDQACPALGEHTTEILAELGYSLSEIDELTAAGVVKARGATGS